jgi:hypothetical protein
LKEGPWPKYRPPLAAVKHRAGAALPRAIRALYDRRSVIERASVVAAGWLLSPVRAWRKRRATRAVRSFRLQREQLEAQFFRQAASLGKPRGLRWLECDWLDTVTFGRDVKSGMLTAFAGVNIRFEAIEGGDMEGLEAVGMVRDAAALFHYHRGRWGTGGRALFNLNPADALARFGGQIEPIEIEG